MQHRAEAGPYRDRLRYDGGFYLELQFCDEHGIPHSHFLGGPNQWTPEDRAKALAYLMEKGERCGLCGTAAWEWQENRRAYSPVEHMCPGCYAKESVSELTGSMPGTTVRLVSAKSQEAAQRIVRQRREAARERERTDDA